MVVVVFPLVRRGAAVERMRALFALLLLLESLLLEDAIAPPLLVELVVVKLVVKVVVVKLVVIIVLPKTTFIISYYGCF